MILRIFMNTGPELNLLIKKAIISRYKTWIKQFVDKRVSKWSQNFNFVWTIPLKEHNISAVFVTEVFFPFIFSIRMKK